MSEQDKWPISQGFLDKLFVHVYCDLGQRFEIHDDFRLYYQLNMARLVRQLLIDGSSGLFTQVNRNYKLSIRFVIPAVGPEPDDLPRIPDEIKNYLPDLNNFPPGYYLHPHRLSGFLNYCPLNLAGNPIKVIEIVKYIANVYGGVHLAPSLEEENEKLLQRFQDSVKIGSSGIVLKALDNIVDITLRALSPLKLAVESRLNGKNY